MIARDPFRINQRERTGLNRNRQPGVIEIAGRVVQIDKQQDGLSVSDTGEK
jgi:hypothetical protein